MKIKVRIFSPEMLEVVKQGIDWLLEVKIIRRDAESVLKVRQFIQSKKKKQLGQYRLTVDFLILVLASSQRLHKFIAWM